MQKNREIVNMKLIIIKMFILYILSIPLVFMMSRLFKQMVDDKEIQISLEELKHNIIKSTRMYKLLDWINFKMGW